MSKNQQISAIISDETKAQVEEYVQSRGIKKGFFIEEALIYHLQALKDIPADLIIPPRLELSGNSMKQISSMMAKAPKPTDDLKELMREP